MAQKRLALRFEPLTAQRWPDLEGLVGDPGACGGCWCMYWRRTRSDFDRHKGDDNRAAFRALVVAGPAPGLLGYHNDRPVGWVALGPRETTPGLDRSRILKRI